MDVIEFNVDKSGRSMRKFINGELAASVHLRTPEVMDEWLAHEYEIYEHRIPKARLVTNRP